MSKEVLIAVNKVRLQEGSDEKHFLQGDVLVHTVDNPGDPNRLAAGINIIDVKPGEAITLTVQGEGAVIVHTGHSHTVLAPGEVITIEGQVEKDPFRDAIVNTYD